MKKIRERHLAWRIKAVMKFSFVTIHVNHLGESIRFYEEMFGLSLIKHLQANAGPMAWLRDESTPDFFLELTEGDVAPGSNHIAFVTDCREQWHAKHSAAGLIDEEIVGLGIYFLHDPDGNHIEVMPTEALDVLAGQ